MPPSIGRRLFTPSCRSPARQTWSKASCRVTPTTLTSCRLTPACPIPARLCEGFDIAAPPSDGKPRAPLVIFEDGAVKATTVAVTHGHAVPALAFRFDTHDGSVVFSGDTAVNDNLIALAQGADILVHQVADLGYLERHGFTGAALDRMAALHTDVSEVGGVAERAGVGDLILNHYLPAEPGAITDAEWAERAGRGFSGRTTAGFDGLRRKLVGVAL